MCLGVQPRVHHVGVVVANIERELAQSVWTAHGVAVVDPIQQCRLCLATLTGDGEPYVELVEPPHAQAPPWAALQRGGGWHHVYLAVPITAAGDPLQRRAPAAAGARLAAGGAVRRPASAIRLQPQPRVAGVSRR